MTKILREWMLRWKSRLPRSAQPGPEPEHAALEPAPISKPLRLRKACFNVTDSPRDFSGFWARVAAGSWEPETLALIEHLVAPGSRFVDIGAWIGPTTLYAAACGAVVDAYECDPVALRCLDANLAVNPALQERVAVRRYGLGDADTTMRLWSVELGNSESSILTRHERDGVVFDCAESAMVGLRDAATVFREYGYAADPAALIKIDVEGAEFRIIPRLAEEIAGSAATWCVSFHELNVNPPHAPAHTARIAEMLRTLLAFSGLRWYNMHLESLDKDAVLEAVIERRWAPHGSLVFSSHTLSE